jgi:hypothetical protein
LKEARPKVGFGKLIRVMFLKLSSMLDGLSKTQLKTVLRISSRALVDHRLIALICSDIRNKENEECNVMSKEYNVMLDQYDAQMRNPENSKETIVSPAPAYSFASIDSMDKLNSLAHRPVEDAEGNSVRVNARSTPIEQSIVALASMKPMNRNQVTGQVAFVPGDKVYHKTRKKEARVLESAGKDGKVFVELSAAKGEKVPVRVHVKAENLVKI